MKPLDIAKELTEKKIHIFYDRELTSESPDYRKKIRHKLVEKLVELNIPLTDQEKLELIDLNKVPQLKNVAMSISHCKQGSGFAINPSGLIGFDMESKKRINDKLIARITTEKERDQSPNTHLCFPAKEAAWKALSSRIEVPTISNFQTCGWQAPSETIYEFQIETNGKLVDGFGLVHVFSDIYLAFFQTS